MYVMFQFDEYCVSEVFKKNFVMLYMSLMFCAISNYLIVFYHSSAVLCC